MFPVTCLDLIFLNPVALIAVILEPFLAIGLGITECIVFYVLFKVVECDYFMGDLIIMQFETVALCVFQNSRRPYQERLSGVFVFS